MKTHQSLYQKTNYRKFRVSKRLYSAENINKNGGGVSSKQRQEQGPTKNFRRDQESQMGSCLPSVFASIKN